MDNPNKRLKVIERIIELVYMSSFVKHSDDKPLSLMLIAPPEQFKSYLLLKYKTPESEVVTDLSFSGLIRLLQGENSKKYPKKTAKIVVIPEFLKVTQKKKSTFENLMGLLNSFLENEGINQILLGNSDKIDLKGVKGAILTATTKHSYHQNMKNWENTGFFSRFLYVSYSFSRETKNEMIDYILEKDSEEKKQKEKTICIKKKKTFVKGIREYNQRIKELSGDSIRQAKKLALLLKTIALSNDRDYIAETDFNELKILNTYLNTDFNII